MVTRNIGLHSISVGSRDMFHNMVSAMEFHWTQPIVNGAGFGFDEVGAALGALPQGLHFGKIVDDV
jgi:hypothetical protein